MFYQLPRGSENSITLFAQTARIPVEWPVYRFFQFILIFRIKFSLSGQQLIQNAGKSRDNSPPIGFPVMPIEKCGSVKKFTLISHKETDYLDSGDQGLKRRDVFYQAMFNMFMKFTVFIQIQHARLIEIEFRRLHFFSCGCIDKFSVFIHQFRDKISQPYISPGLCRIPSEL